MPQKENDAPQKKKVEAESDEAITGNEADAQKKDEEALPEADAAGSGVEKGVPKEEGKTGPEELLKALQRTTADFENFRKRTEKSVAEASRAANDDLILRFLDVYDNLDRAARTDFTTDPEAAKEGIVAIVQQMWKIMTQEQVRPIDSLGTLHDPYYQYSVSRTNDPSKPDRTVVEEYQRGYMIREKVLRPALVCVNRREIPAPAKHDLNNEGEDTEESE